MGRIEAFFKREGREGGQRRFCHPSHPVGKPRVEPSVKRAINSGNDQLDGLGGGERSLLVRVWRNTSPTKKKGGGGEKKRSTTMEQVVA